MTRVEKHIIKASNPHYDLIDEFLFASKNLYNAALYCTRFFFFEGDYVPNYYELEKNKSSSVGIGECYKAMVKAQCAQQTLMLADKTWVGYWGSVKAYNAE
jgi:hypothetical protein